MSLRPRQPGLARVDQARSRMAPGGRRWSESPVPRVGKRRTRTTLESDLATLTTYHSGTVTTSASTVSTSMGGTSAGELTVCTVIARGYAIADPSGSWTNILAGSVSDLTYRVSYIVNSGSTTSAFGLSGAGTGAAMQMLSFSDYGSRVPSVTAVTESASASTVNFPAIDPRAMSPYQVLGYLPTTPGAFTTTSDPAIIQTDQLSEITVAGVLQLNVQQPRDPTWLDAFPGPVSTSSTLTTSAAGEWVRFGMGLS